MQTEAITLQAEVFVWECMADTKKATAYAMTQKPPQEYLQYDCVIDTG